MQDGYEDSVRIAADNLANGQIGLTHDQLLPYMDISINRHLDLANGQIGHVWLEERGGPTAL